MGILRKNCLRSISKSGIKDTFVLMMFSVLLIGAFSSIFCVQGMYLDYSPINGFDHEACLDTCFSNEDDPVVKVIEHKIGEFELEELKREVGVYENDANYNRVINGYGTGLRPPTDSEWTRISEEAFLVEEILWIDQTASPPLEVDHTTTLWFPPIGSQGGEGSCTTWAVGYYMKTFQEAKEHGWDLSGAVWEGGYSGYPSAAYQDKIFSPDFIYHQINDGVDDGSSFEDAMNLVCLIGACSWQKMPYDDSDSVMWPSEGAWREAPLYRGNSSGFEYLISNTDAKLESVKNWIASDHLAAIAVDADQYSDLTSNDVWTLDNYVDPDENHANTIVGYDDGLSYTEQGEFRQGAFKIANSWGIGWSGDHNFDGCYWISYEAMKQCIDRVMFYGDRIAYEPKLVASFRIDHAERDDCYITLGIGDKNASIQTKKFNDWYQDGGSHPFCSNNIVFDITEFEEAVPTVIGQNFFLEVFEFEDLYNITGTILDFSIEYYENYSSHVPHVSAISDDPPVDTIPDSYVYAEVTLLPSITIEQFFVSDNRCDVGSMQTVGCHAVCTKNGSSVTGGTIWVNDTGHSINNTGWCTFDVTSSNVEKNTWAVTDVSCNGAQYYEVTAPNPYIIFDKVNIILTVNDSRIDAGSEAPINWTGVYAYDGATFLGSIVLNDSVTKNQVGRYGFTVASISDPTYDITAFDSNEVYCIWDRIKISDGGVTHSSTNITQEETVWFRIEYEYDGISFSGEVYINDTLVTYLALYDRWEYNYTLFSPGTATFTASQIVDDLYELTSVNDAVGPLSVTLHHFQIIHEGEIYEIPMTTNSRISNLQFTPSLRQIMFNVTGETETMGYCNITIPKILLKAKPSSAWVVLLDGYSNPYIATENETHTFIYISYTHSGHRIQIRGTWAIPEYLIIMILLILIVGAMLVALFYRHTRKTRP